MSISGTPQPRATVPVPRRSVARAVWASALGNANQHGPSGVSSGWSVTRRQPAGGFFGGIAVAAIVATAVTGGHAYQHTVTPHRAVWSGTTVTTVNAHGPNGTVQPRATVPVPRRTAARAVTRAGAVSPILALPVTGGRVAQHTVTPHRAVSASILGPANAHGPNGTAQPRATVPVPRRSTARAAWARILGTVNAHGPSAVSSGAWISRRQSSGEWYGGIASSVVPVTSTGTPVTGGHAYQRTQPHRAVKASAAGTANQHGPSGTVQPRAAVPVPRRGSARVLWSSVAGPANAHGGNGTVQPRAAVPVPRRTAARGAWHQPPPVTPAAATRLMVLAARSARIPWTAGSARIPWAPGSARNS